MKIKIKRIYRGESYTIGRLYLDYEDGMGFEYFCDTLEDKCRIINGDCSAKIYGQTAIPEGTYEMEMIYWKKHKNWYPHIIDVKCFIGILIHSGADELDTEGCILVGFNKIKGHLIDGIETMRKLRIILKDTYDIQGNIPLLIL